MKKYILLPLLTLIMFTGTIFADEGMWLPQLLQELNESDMKEAGLQLSASDLYNINGSSLKDAIVSLNGGGCTAEMISKEGLLLTNHHCAYDEIQSHSSVNNDYLENGFWAKNRSEELVNKGLTASFLIKIEDVSDRVFSEITNEMSYKEKGAKIKEISQNITKEATDQNHYNARVKSFFGGNKYYLMVYETFKDVRLVGAPPSSIGKFGGDTDNWMWPRHTGDFALLRIYCDSNGKPAEYNKNNVPYTPKHHLPIQLDGVENEDFTMIFGFPGRTNRYLTSYGIEQALDISNPTIIDIRDEKLAVMKAGMDASKKTKIQYASKHASTANYWKYYIGQSKGLKRMKVFDKKQGLENEFEKWIKSGDSARKDKYGNVLSLIKKSYEKNRKIEINRQYLNEAVFQGAEIMYFSYLMNRRLSSIPKEGKERVLALRKIKKDAVEFYKNYDPTVDQELFSSLLEMYYYNVPKNQHASVFKRIENQLFGFKSLDFDYYAKNVFRRSIFASKEKFFEFIKNPNILTIKRDPAFRTISSIYDKYMSDIYPIRSQIREDLAKSNKLFISGIMEMDSVKKFYPDANSTMRATYGRVGDYTAGEAMHYDYFTTIDGIFEKEDPKDEEFMVPEKLKMLWQNKEYGEYGDKNGNLRINFISNNDITGGNSGSPVINAWGELVGTAFDGNWEAMSGDIAFENNIQRTISVDIRYIMFVIDKFAGAGYLIDEMTIAPRRGRPDIKVEKNKDTVEKIDRNPNLIITKLNTKKYLGLDVPVFDMHSFGSAFDMAVEKYGSSKDQLFWWHDKIYTTEKR